MDREGMKWVKSIDTQWTESRTKLSGILQNDFKLKNLDNAVEKFKRLCGQFDEYVFDEEPSIIISETGVFEMHLYACGMGFMPDNIQALREVLKISDIFSESVTPSEDCDLCFGVHLHVKDDVLRRLRGQCKARTNKEKEKREVIVTEDDSRVWQASCGEQWKAWKEKFTREARLNEKKMQDFENVSKIFNELFLQEKDTFVHRIYPIEFTETGRGVLKIEVNNLSMGGKRLNLFKNIINATDGFSVGALINDDVRMYFSVHNVFMLNQY